MYPANPFILLLFLFSLSPLCSKFCSGNRLDQNDDRDTIQDSVIHLAQSSIAKHLLEYGGQLLKQNLHHYSEMVQNVNRSLIESNDDRECYSLLIQTLENPFGQEWSAKMIDSTGSLFGTGLLSGTYSKFGDFDSCLSIESNYSVQSNHPPANNVTASSRFLAFVGQFCWTTIRLPVHVSKLSDYLVVEENSIENDIQFNQTWKHDLLKRWMAANVRYPISNGFCMPSVCRPEFVRKIILDVFTPLNRTELGVDYCQTKTNQPFAQWFNAKLAVCIILGSIISLVIFGTILELIPQYKSSDWIFIRIVTCFSLMTNVGRLLVVKKRTEYPWIDGWRVLLNTIVLLTHVSIMQGVLQTSSLSPFAHFPDAFQRLTTPIINRYLVNSTCTIKSFFMMSGFLLSVNFLKRKRIPNFGQYVLNRWLRFVPSLIGYIILTLVFGFIGNGPLFHQDLIEPYIKPCLDNLPAHFLFVNNWLDFRQMCGFQTWYISADFQLYVLAFLVLFLYHNNFTNFAHTISLIFILVAYVITLIIFVFKIHGIPFFISVLYPELPFADRGFLLYWTATYNHFEAYFLGIMIGTLAGKKLPFNLSKPFIKNALILSQLMLLVWPHLFPLFLKPIDQRSATDLVNSYSWFDALVSTTSNFMWLISISLMFYLASTYGYIVRNNLFLKVMSSTCLVPFARISFTSYLVHVPMTWFVVHQTRFPLVINEFGAFRFGLFMFFSSTLAATAIHLLFELPFARLVTLFFRFHTEKSNINENEMLKALDKMSNNKNNNNKDNNGPPESI